jgi:hypothetical protein
MFIRRPKLENLLRKLLLGAPSNIRILVGTVRGLHLQDNKSRRADTVIVRRQNGEEVTIKNPALVIGRDHSHKQLRELTIQTDRLLWG